MSCQGDDTTKILWHPKSWEASQEAMHKHTKEDLAYKLIYERREADLGANHTGGVVTNDKVNSTDFPNFQARVSLYLLNQFHSKRSLLDTSQYIQQRKRMPV